MATVLCSKGSFNQNVTPAHCCNLRATIPRWLEEQENGLSERFRRLLRGLWEDLLTIDQRVEELDREIEQIARQDPVAVRLQQLRGIGPVTATALLATVGDASPIITRYQRKQSSTASSNVGVSEPRLHNKPHDGQQVEPALTEPANV